MVSTIASSSMSLIHRLFEISSREFFTILNCIISISTIFLSISSVVCPKSPSHAASFSCYDVNLIETNTMILINYRVCYFFTSPILLAAACFCDNIQWSLDVSYIHFKLPSCIFTIIASKFQRNSTFSVTINSINLLVRNWC